MYFVQHNPTAPDNQLLGLDLPSGNLSVKAVFPGAQPWFARISNDETALALVERAPRIGESPHTIAVRDLATGQVLSHTFDQDGIIRPPVVWGNSVVAAIEKEYSAASGSSFEKRLAFAIIDRPSGEVTISEFSDYDSGSFADFVWDLFGKVGETERVFFRLGALGDPVYSLRLADGRIEKAPPEASMVSIVPPDRIRGNSKFELLEEYNTDLFGNREDRVITRFSRELLLPYSDYVFVLDRDMLQGYVLVCHGHWKEKLFCLVNRGDGRKYGVADVDCHDGDLIYAGWVGRGEGN
ncbi:MAG: hypothetical protein NTW86_03030 [Candidatus Sumerlaeota bacterium]|nr:hypothetical protein [Candidatus Sumerlaeota bacterium]